MVSKVTLYDVGKIELEKLKRYLNKVSKTEAKCKEEEIVQCYKCNHFTLKKLYAGDYYCANCEYYAEGSKDLRSTVIIFDNKFKHFNNIITQLLTDNIDREILKRYKEFDDILKYKSKSFRVLLKRFLHINRLDYILTLKIVNYCFERKYFSQEDITDLSNLFEAYLHFLLYKKSPNISINYNSFLCDAFIFLRSRKNTNFNAICFPPVNEESKRNNYTQDKRHLIINDNFLEKRKLWEEFIESYCN
jgi:ribosomal protein L37AE/L43A